MQLATEVSPREKAFLVDGNQKLPVSVECASKYSLFFRYIDDQHFCNTDGHINLLFKKNGNSVELGPCRILTDSDLNGYSGRIVFTENVYDIQSFLLDKKVTKLQTSFSDLPLILDRKDNIRPTFKQYTGDLAYDLSVYKNAFDGLDRQYCDEPPGVRKSIQEAIINKEGQEFIQFLNDKLFELSDVISDFSSEEHQRHGFYFRLQLWNFIYCSAFMTRTNLKPRGFAGDSKMMKMVYANDYIGDTTFEKLMHNFGLRQPGAESVRNRRQIVANMLKTINNDIRLTENQRFRVLSVACGPSEELRDILISAQDFTKYHFTLLDQDRLALAEASQVVEELNRKTGAEADTAFVPASVRMLIANKAFKQSIGQFHFIYSLGLFDYLSPRVGNIVIRSLYNLLEPGGLMIIGNFHVLNQSKHFLNYWLDWNLYHRSEEELLMLSKGIPSSEVSIFFENTGNQMFLEIKKAEME